MNLRKYIGDRNFYRRLTSVMVPVLIQNIITNFVSLLDNVMVGRVGTEPMSGVAIVNQLIFVFNICTFGTMAGPGILSAQFYGKGDHDGVRFVFRIKVFFSVILVAVAETVFLLHGDSLIQSFLHKSNDGLNLAVTFSCAREYMKVMLFQVPLFALIQIYGSSLRETGETKVPMLAGIIAVGVNLVFNYILIFGKLGAPVMGVKGAAIATVISRVVECAIICAYTHTHGERHPFINGAFSSMHIPGPLMKQVLLLGAPLLTNEVLWSTGSALLNQCYSTRGLEAVSAVNIATTVSNLFFCAFFAMGTTVSIIVGQLLGSGQLERAMDEDRKLIAFSVALCTVVGAVMILAAPYIPLIYNTTDSVKKLASVLLIVSGAMMPANAYTYTCYFTLRSGGKTIITFLFDSAFMWAVSLPVAFAVSRLTSLPLPVLFICVQALDFIKCISGFFLVRSGKWVNNLVAQ